MFLSLILMIVGIGLLRFSVSQMEGYVPPLLRSFGMLDQKIDESTGGNASASWRYLVWQSALGKIEESPLAGHGFGNLPQHIDPWDPNNRGSDDFETLLAGGEAHNGFINASYAFGIPFTAALTLAIVYFFVKEAALSFATDRHDEELRDTHAFLACQFATYPTLIYAAFDMSVILLWNYTALAIILDQIRAKSGKGSEQTPEPALPGYGSYKYSSPYRA